MEEQKQNTPFYQQVADKIIEQLEKGAAPWLRPWKPGEYRLPHNPVSGVRYKGANALWLSMVSEGKGYGDHRWMTYKQAQSSGAQVRRGESGTLVQYWKFTDRVLERDEDGKPVLDQNGEQKRVEVQLERPKVFHAVVFNARQIDGLPPLKVEPPSWDPNARAEAILAQSGARIHHDQGNRAFYRPATDAIHLPDRAQFEDAAGYYATALHELGHWTGHESRLNRDLAHPFGSEAYAKEELRAEIASLMLGDQLGIGHDPGQHAAYVDSWIKVLRDDPKEIIRASRDAERITRFVTALELSREQEGREAEHKRPAPAVHSMGDAPMSGPARTATEKTYLAVPYAEKDQAKARGAKWDAKAKSWYAPLGAELSKLARWLPERAGPRQEPAKDPRDEFALALKQAGLQIEGLPAMDGRLHRVKAEGDTGPARSGAYVGHLDGRPAGFIQNFKTGLKMNWKSDGARLSAEEKTRLKAEAAQKRAAREKERHRTHLHQARRCAQLYGRLPDVSANHPYLVKKGIPPFPGVKMDKKGRLVIPLKDEQGALWSLQRIADTGFKSLKKGARKQGLFFVAGDETQLGRDPIISCEGYATGATLALATGKPVVVALDSGNLPPVTKALANAYPGALHIVAGDDDRHKAAEGKPNVGRQKAREAAEAVGGQAIFPSFLRAEVGKDFTDFNDLQRVRGLEAVKHQVEAALGRARQKGQERSSERKPPEINKSVELSR